MAYAFVQMFVFSVGVGGSLNCSLFDIHQKLYVSQMHRGTNASKHKSYNTNKTETLKSASPKSNNLSSGPARSGFPQEDAGTSKPSSGPLHPVPQADQWAEAREVGRSERSRVDGWLALETARAALEHGLPIGLPVHSGSACDSVARGILALGRHTAEKLPFQG